MLTRSLDQIIDAAHRLPDHLVVARRHYGHSPDVVRALLRLQDALMEVDSTLIARRARPSAVLPAQPTEAEDAQPHRR